MIQFHLNLLESLGSGVLNKKLTDLHINNITNRNGQQIYVAQRHMPTMDDWTKERVEESSQLLQQELEKNGKQMNVIPAHVVTVYDHLLEDLEAGKLLTFGSEHYVILELPKGHIPGYTAKTIYDLQMKGYQPILLYPEQNRLIQADPTIIYQMVKKGLVVLISGQSIIGKDTKKSQQLAKQMIQHNLAHLVNVDTETDTDKLWKRIKKDHGVEMERLLIENASCIETDYPIIMNEPSRIKKKNLLSIL